MVIIIVLVLLFLLAVKGRRGHKDLPLLRGWFYAHRGLHGQGVPENSMTAFCRAKDAGYGIELDVHLMKDGQPAVTHDSSLDRCAGVDVRIEDLTAQDLEHYRLEGTEEMIPLFSQVLDAIHGAVPLIVELKSDKANYAALCGAVCKLLDTYGGVYCVESFDPRCVFWLRKHRKDIVRGQLVKNYFRDDSALPGFLKFALRHQLFNVFTNPDFVAYRFSDRKTVSNFLCRKIWGVQGVTWTLQNQEDFTLACKENWIPIFENFKP